jgi:transmembrane sensor
MKNRENYTDREWEELASSLSGETKDKQSELIRDFLSVEEGQDTEQKWNELADLKDEHEINVDDAWDRVYSRLSETGLFAAIAGNPRLVRRNNFIKIAAAAIILLSIGTLAVYFGDSIFKGQDIIVATGNDEKNLKVTLPDGSTVILNRNTELGYNKKFGKSERNVILSGEAFFEIKPDPERPFTADAGKAVIKVTGTSFNVITNNSDLAVEVFVNTGKVILSDNSGAKNIVLEPGYIGTMDSDNSAKKLNDDPNYMSWKSGLLVYTGQKMDIVFRDLKRVHNMEIIADDPEILDYPWTSPIEDGTQETIILLICRSFNLTYTKDGNIYHLAKK